MVQRALVFLPRCIGDTLLSTPMLRQLKRLHCEAEVHVVCSGASRAVIEHNEHIDQVTVLKRGTDGSQELVRIVTQSWRQRYDLVVDLYARVKTAIVSRLTGAPQRNGLLRRWPRNGACYTHPIPAVGHEYVARQRIRLLAHEGIDLDDYQLEFPTAAADQQVAAAFCETHFRRPVAALYAVASSNFMQWPFEKSAEIGRRLQAAGYQVLLIHGPGQRPMAQQLAESIGGDCIVDYTCQSLPVMKETLANCALFIGNDGGPKHIATAAGIPTVCAFPHDYAEEWTAPGRPSQRFAVVRHGRELVDYFGKVTQAHTLADITVDDLWEQVEILTEQGYLQRPESRPLRRIA